MKVIFAGPTVPDAASICGSGIAVRPPARQGDLLRAVLDGASVIGLIDGNFEDTAPVWHKEILYGLSQGVRIFGSSSMGALRAAECRMFGMEGVGEVYRRYATAQTIDDADVALVHAPAEMGYTPFSIPLINVVATLESMEATGKITKEEKLELQQIAEGIFYKERTWRAIETAVHQQCPARETNFVETVRASYIDIKRADALALIKAVSDATPSALAVKPSWVFQSTSMWRSALRDAKT